MCFYCEKRYDVSEIKEWILDEKDDTATCPYCDIDSVIPSLMDKKEITDEMVQELYEYYFNANVD